MKVEQLTLYENRPDVTLTTYIIDDSVELLNGKKRPAILICPGGAFLFCSDREGEAVALRFAAMGYHTFVLRYSVYRGGDMESLSEGPYEADPNSVYPNPMLDIGEAMRVIHEHQEDWLVDIHKICLCGFSAGAHNCAMYSVYWNAPLFKDYFKTEVSGYKPAAAILAYGITDYYQLRQNRDEEQTENLIDLSYFGTSHPSEEQLIMASPARQVSKDTPPMFIWTTTDDKTLPSKQSLYMALALAEQDVPYEIHVFDEGDHGLVLADASTAGARFQDNHYVAVWADLAKQWLARHLPIDVPEIASRRG